MKKFAKIDASGIVEQVIVAEQDFIDTMSGNWIETSDVIRRRPAGIGYTYDEGNDVFVEPQPHPSWTLDENFDWQCPVPMPADGPWSYYWDEDKQEWVNYYKALL